VLEGGRREDGPLGCGRPHDSSISARHRVMNRNGNNVYWPSRYGSMYKKPPFSWQSHSKLQIRLSCTTRVRSVVSSGFWKPMVLRGVSSHSSPTTRKCRWLADFTLGTCGYDGKSMLLPMECIPINPLSKSRFVALTLCSNYPRSSQKGIFHSTYKEEDGSHCRTECQSGHCRPERSNRRRCGGEYSWLLGRGRSQMNNGTVRATERHLKGVNSICFGLF
jgi:hypothetical protein